MASPSTASDFSGDTPSEARQGVSGGTQQQRLFNAVLRISAQLDLDPLLDQLLVGAQEVTGSQYAALIVTSASGRPAIFRQRGASSETAALIGAQPHGLGVLGRIPPRGALVIDDVATHSAFRGWPAHHPRLGPFIGVAIHVRGSVFGHLYAANSPDGPKFDEEVVNQLIDLCTAAGIAIENATVFAGRTQRVRWITAGQQITNRLLEGADEEEVLEAIAASAREVANADAAAIVLPSIDDNWILEIATGLGAEDLIGSVMPPDGRSLTVLREGSGLIVDSLSRTRTLRVAALRRYGPAMYAPLTTSGRGLGVLLLLREIGAPTFEDQDLLTAESFAAQAALALVLAESRHANDVATLLDERERIARDLHDLAIQQLFAAGMQLDSMRRRAESGLDPAELTQIIDDALNNIDGTIQEIRTIVRALRDPDADVGIVERLRRETSLARTGLGFAPSLVISVDGQPIDGPDSLDDAAHRADTILDRELADDTVAVVREGLANAARHARAASVQVLVALRSGSQRAAVVVEVSDDGVGNPRRPPTQFGFKELGRARPAPRWNFQRQR